MPFQIGGKLEVSGTDAARHGEFLPPQINGIPIDQQALRIQLLHGARHGQKDGTPLANLVFHFKNGETRKVRLAFGLHARNYLEEITSISATQSVRELADPNSQIVWRNHPASTNEPLARLYKTTIANPLPDQQIATLDFVSLFSRATPIIFAITVDNDPNPPPLLPMPNRKVVQRAMQFDDSYYRADLKVRVTEGSGGKPVANAAAILTIKDDSRSFFFGQYKSDPSGQLTLSYPAQQAVSLNLRVSSPGYVPASTLLTSSESQKWAETLDLVLSQGSPIGGFVLDSNGKPIPGASVIPCRITQTKSNEYTRTDFDVLKTDSTGKWIGTAQSETLSNLSFEITHPEFHSVFFKQLAASDLLRINARAALDPHIRIVGRVVANGAPIPNATVLLDNGGDSRGIESHKVDSDGRFSFIVRDPTNNTATVIATANNYAPASYSVSLPPSGGPLTLSLDSGSTLRMRFVDQNNLPVAGVKVSLVRWQNSQALQWRTVS
ncbi:MAG TPA: carboxypeptidase-like regulatory domain-containing protein, partial [Verrucomicrobiae bacterium]|nr:carboxypeptidase-like regulatory domain-containing protein [Verrucomicrobiae bacterium]